VDPPSATATPFIIAHEFFDALPVHVFVSHERPAGPASPDCSAPRAPRCEWRELLVDVTAPPSALLLPPGSQGSAKAGSAPGGAAEFEFAVSRSPTPHARLLPGRDPRAAGLLDGAPGSTVEMSAEALSLAGAIARHIAPPALPAPPPSSSSPSSSSRPAPSPRPPARGAALLLDYGTLEALPAATLRGIRAHRLLAGGGAAGALESPGLVDVSAHVDFAGLARAALEATATATGPTSSPPFPPSSSSPPTSSSAVEIHGPVTQADWLEALGISQRGEALERAVAARHQSDSQEAAEEARRRVREGWRRVADRGPAGMGNVYKAMAIVPAGSRAAGGVVGFGGGVVGA
jgi:hypothetical protein